MGRKRVSLLVSAVLAVAVGVAGCGAGDGGDGGKSAAGVGEKGVVKIGLLAPLSGRSAADGEEMKRGAQLAIDEINAAGGAAGYGLELVPADVEDLTPDKVRRAAERLLADEDVHAVVTAYASTSNFEIDLMAEQNMPYLLGANPDQTKGIISKDPDGYPTVWSLQPSYELFHDLYKFVDDAVASGDAEVRDRTAYLVNSDNPVSTEVFKGVKKNLEDNGWTIVGEDTVPFTAVSDWRPILSKIRQTNPDLVANFDWNPSNEALFLQQFLEDPTDSYVYLYYAPSVPEFLELTGDDADGVIWSLVGGPVTKSERAQHISKAYADKYDDEAGSVVMKLYEEVYAYAKALENVGDPADHTAIGNALGTLEVPETANGPLAFDPGTHLARSGDNHFPIQYYQYQDGKVVTISPDWAADATFTTPPWRN